MQKIQKIKPTLKKTGFIILSILSSVTTMPAAASTHVDRSVKAKENAAFLLGLCVGQVVRSQKMFVPATQVGQPSPNLSANNQTQILPPQIPFNNSLSVSNQPLMVLQEPSNQSPLVPQPSSPTSATAAQSMTSVNGAASARSLIMLQVPSPAQLHLDISACKARVYGNKIINQTNQNSNNSNNSTTNDSSSSPMANRGNGPLTNFPGNAPANPAALGDGTPVSTTNPNGGMIGSDMGPVAPVETNPAAIQQNSPEVMGAPLDMSAEQQAGVSPIQQVGTAVTP